MKHKITFSDFNFGLINTQSPALPLHVTIQVIPDGAPNAENLIRITLPGCLFLPLEAGADGTAGKLREPIHYRYRGTRPMPNVKIGPDSFRTHIETLLKGNSDVQIWTRKIIAAIENGQDNLKALAKLKAWREAEDPFINGKQSTEAE